MLKELGVGGVGGGILPLGVCRLKGFELKRSTLRYDHEYSTLSNQPQNFDLHVHSLSGSNLSLLLLNAPLLHNKLPSLIGGKTTRLKSPPIHMLTFDW